MRAGRQSGLAAVSAWGPTGACVPSSVGLADSSVRAALLAPRLVSRLTALAAVTAGGRSAARPAGPSSRRCHLRRHADGATERHRQPGLGPDQRPGRALPLRPPGPGRLLPRRRRRLQVRALRALPRPGQAVELLRRRRLAHGPARLQRGPPRHDVERPRAGHGAGQRPGHLRPRAARPTRTSSTRPCSTATSRT